jgi:hypothetical protein
MTTFTTEDRINASPPHIVDSGASVMEMNANELADYITQNSYIGTVTMEEVATMLRQQQAEIEVLKVALQIMGIDADSILRKAQEK